MKIDTLDSLIGREQPLDRICVELKNFAIDLSPAVVGAHHVTCSDETERECLDMFSDVFVKPLLPTLKLAQQSAFRTANLGAQYEWGSVKIAEHHFATSETVSSFKLMVVKINAHVSRGEGLDGVKYGRLDRYNEQSDCCGALFALMRGGMLPSIERIREVFEWEGIPRIRALTDADGVRENLRGLVAAIVQARLQARVAMTDIRDSTPFSPTLFLVLPCVTINIPELDTELLCGVYTADMRTEAHRFTYRGLGDDPSELRIDHDGGVLVVSSEGSDQLREARDHRQVPLRTFLERQDTGSPQYDNDAISADGLIPELEEIVRRAPTEGALRLFAAGVVPVHYVFAADRIARGSTSHDDILPFYSEAQVLFDACSTDEKEPLIEKFCAIKTTLS